MRPTRTYCFEWDKDRWRAFAVLMPEPRHELHIILGSFMGLEAFDLAEHCARLYRDHDFHFDSATGEWKP